MKPQKVILTVFLMMLSLSLIPAQGDRLATKRSETEIALPKIEWSPNALYEGVPVFSVFMEAASDEPVRRFFGVDKKIFRYEFSEEFKTVIRSKQHTETAAFDHKAFLASEATSVSWYKPTWEALTPGSQVYYSAWSSYHAMLLLGGTLRWRLQYVTRNYNADGSYYDVSLPVSGWVDEWVSWYYASSMPNGPSLSYYIPNAFCLCSGDWISGNAYYDQTIPADGYGLRGNYVFRYMAHTPPGGGKYPQTIVWWRCLGNWDGWAYRMCDIFVTN